MRSFACLTLLVVTTLGCARGERASATAGKFLYVWAGDSAETASDFLAVLDADPASPKYGTVISTLETGVIGSNPHHTEAEMPATGHLFANGFHAGATWVFDLKDPRKPRIISAFGDQAGFSHPHTFVRLANGNLLATYQYRADSTTRTAKGMGDMPGMRGMMFGALHTTGGLVEMTERGDVVRSASAADPAVADGRIYPYSAIELPAADRVVSTTTDMDHMDTVSTSEWVQFWRRSDLKLLRSIALPPGPRGDEHKYTGEPHLLADGKSVYVHTFSCGLYLVRGAETDAPRATFVKGFQGTGCGVPILTGHWWLQPVPDTHSLVTLDISDPEHPREVSTLALPADEAPHWIALDPTGKRVVLNSGGGGPKGVSPGNRLYVIGFDPATGALTLDAKFKDAGSTRAGVAMSARSWPHGWTGTAIPHGSVFSR